MKIARVFPRRTNASPDDPLAFFGPPPLLFPPEVDEVHVSVAFTYDIPQAEFLAAQWSAIAPVKIGGPAYGKPSGDFVAGQYLKKGYTITSRGCPNKCWFCAVHKREGGGMKELPIVEGNIVHDDNVLACSEGHIRSVFSMLRNQKERPQFRGLEAKLLKPWHVDLIAGLRDPLMFFACDTPDDEEPLHESGKMLKAAGYDDHNLLCYVLIGFPRDTFQDAERRLKYVIGEGFLPFAMLCRDRNGETSGEWRKFQRQWVRPHIIGANMNKKKIDLPLFDGIEI